MHQYTTPAWARTVYTASGYLTEDFGPGPKQLKMAWVINLHKIITLFFYLRMYVKDASISRYPEWHEYAARSSRLLPWGLLGAMRRGTPSHPQPAN